MEINKRIQLNEMFKQLIKLQNKFTEISCNVSGKDCNSCPFNKTLNKETNHNGSKSNFTICDALMNITNKQD